MGIFNYECINGQGEVVRGQLNVADTATATARLKTMNLMVLNLTEKKASSLDAFKLEKKVKIGDLSLFSRQLSAMLKAGIPITRALYTLSRQTVNPNFRNALETIARNVEGGMSLSEAFGAYPKIFSPLYLAMLHTGEIGGMLEDSLNRMSEQLQKEKTLKDNIRSATFYPKVILGFACLLLIAMLTTLVPIFESYIPKSVKLPFATKMIFGLSHSVRSYWYMWILCIGLIIGAVMWFVRSPLSKGIWERIRFKIPGFGSLMQKSVVARFTRTLATLMEGGIPVVQALESAGPTSGSTIVADAVKEATKKIEEGKSIAGPLEDSGVFPPMVIHMISVGEETGSLPSLLDKVADFYEEEVAIITKGLTSLIEPIMLIGVGLLVGGMLIALYLPIFTATVSSGG